MEVDTFCRRVALWLLVPLFVVLGACGSIKETVRGYGQSAAKGFAEGIPQMKDPTKKLFRDMLLEGDTLKLATDQAVATAEIGRAHV